MKHARCEHPLGREHAPPVRAIAGLVALALLSAPAAGVAGLVLDELDAPRAVFELFYLWFWLTVLVVLLGALAGVTLWAIVRLSAIALGSRGTREPLDW
jgi:hypothetical protein